MDFLELLELGHSRLYTDKIVNEILDNPHRMDELIKLFVKGPVQITQRAAWSISVVAEKHPEYLFNYFDLFIELLNTPNKHDSVNRNIIRAFQFMEIPEKYEGEVLDVVFKLLKSSKEPIAVKAFSMTVIYNLSKKYPDIIPELKASIEALLPNGSAGIKNRGNKILKAISRR